MFQFHPTVSFDSVIVLFGFGGTIAAQWFFLRFEVKQIRRDVEGLKRGRGLILGANSDWPDAVRRCFGFGHPTKNDAS